MSHMSDIFSRAQNQCELCSSPQNLSLWELRPSAPGDENGALVICSECKNHIKNPGSSASSDSDYWKCLETAIWSEYTPVKVMSYRLLTFLQKKSWAFQLLEQLFLTEEELQLAKAAPLQNDSILTTEENAATRDANGGKLEEGDSVTLIKDLEVKGANFTAKRGTLVKNIRLTNNPKHIEGKVNGMQIVIIAEYVKKS